jgi:hypothetical protein
MDQKTPMLEQVYTNVCAQIGERYYLIQKLTAEIAILTKQLDEVKPAQSEPAQS